MIIAEGLGQAIPAEPTVSPALPPGKVSHSDLRVMLRELRGQLVALTDAVGQTRTAIETHTGAANQSLAVAQQALAALQSHLNRIEALIAASL